jgi:hypothetical protein
LFRRTGQGRRGHAHAGADVGGQQGGRASRRAGLSGRRWQGRNINVPVPDYINDQSQSSANHGIHSVACFWSYGDDEGTYAGNVLAEGIGSIRENLNLNKRDGTHSWAKSISALTWGNC